MKIPTISDRDWLSRLVHIQFVPPTFYFNNVYFESNGWKSWRRFSEETQRRWNIVRRTRLRIKLWRIIFTRASRIGWSTLIVHWWIQLKILSQIKKNERISHTWRSSMKKNLLLCESNETDSSNLEIERSRYDEKYLLGQVREKMYSRIGRNGQKCGKRADISTSTVGEARLNGSRAYISSEHMRSVARVATFWRVEQRRNGVIWSYGLARIP